MNALPRCLGSAPGTLAFGGELGKRRMAGHGLVESVQHRDGRRVLSLKDRVVMLLNEGEELRLQVLRYAHEGRKGREMLTGTLSHFLSQIIEIDAREHIDSLILDNDAIVCTTRCAA